MMKLCLIVVATVLLTGCQKQMTPVEVGNGGHGVERNGKIYLLDLVEINAQDSEISLTKARSPRAQRLISKLSQSLAPSRFPLEPIAAKLMEIEAVDPILFHSLIHIVGRFHYKFTTTRLRSIPSDDGKIQLGELVIASRQTGNIFINQEYWSRMDPTNQTALVIHELVYSFLPAVEHWNNEYLRTHRQSARRAREITQLFFRPTLPRVGLLSQFVKPKEIPHFVGLENESATLSRFDSWKGRITGTALTGGTVVGPVSIVFPKQQGLVRKITFVPGTFETNAVREVCEKRPETIELMVGEEESVPSTYEISHDIYSDGYAMKTRMSGYPIAHKKSILSKQFLPESNCESVLPELLKAKFDELLWDRE